ncbi:hypothetical protein BU25DRAFT_329298, partial [Macroventuria anomochaeta]
MKSAFEEIDSMIPCDKIPWTALAKKHKVVRSTLSRKYRHETRSREEKAIAQQKLTPQQEDELVKYIEELTARRLPPTREMIANFALSIATEPVSES